MTVSSSDFHFEDWTSLQESPLQKKIDSYELILTQFSKSTITEIEKIEKAGRVSLRNSYTKALNTTKHNTTP